MTDTVELWSPITDAGMSMTPGELIVGFMDLGQRAEQSDRQPVPVRDAVPGMVVIDRHGAG